MRRASFAGTKFGGGGTPEAIPLSRDATGPASARGGQAI